MQQQQGLTQKQSVALVGRPAVFTTVLTTVFTTSSRLEDMKALL